MIGRSSTSGDLSHEKSKLADMDGNISKVRIHVTEVWIRNSIRTKYFIKVLYLNNGIMPTA